MKKKIFLVVVVLLIAWAAVGAVKTYLPKLTAKEGPAINLANTVLGSKLPAIDTKYYTKYEMNDDPDLFKLTLEGVSEENFMNYANACIAGGFDRSFAYNPGESYTGQNKDEYRVVFIRDPKTQKTVITVKLDEFGTADAALAEAKK